MQYIFEENERVDRMAEAIDNDDFDLIKRMIDESGKSSWELLQNCYCQITLQNKNFTGIDTYRAFPQRNGQRMPCTWWRFRRSNYVHTASERCLFI